MSSFRRTVAQVVADHLSGAYASLPADRQAEIWRNTMTPADLLPGLTRKGLDLLADIARLDIPGFNGRHVVFTQTYGILLHCSIRTVGEDGGSDYSIAFAALDDQRSWGDDTNALFVRAPSTGDRFVYGLRRDQVVDWLRPAAMPMAA